MAQSGFAVAIPAAIAERVLKALNPPGTELASEEARVTAKHQCGEAIADLVHKVEVARARAAVGEPPEGIT